MFGFFFKQKTAYEMRISDWSSDVCSSDLPFGQSLPLLWVSIRGSTPTTSPAATRRCMPHWTPQNAQWVETQRSSALSVSQPPVASAPAEWRSATPGGVGYLVLRARRRRRLVLIVRKIGRAHV